MPRESAAIAPGWPFTMLNELAKHVNANRVLLEPGDRIDMRSPVTVHPHVPDAPQTSSPAWRETDWLLITHPTEPEVI